MISNLRNVRLVPAQLLGVGNELLWQCIITVAVWEVRPFSLPVSLVRHWVVTLLYENELLRLNRTVCRKQQWKVLVLKLLATSLGETLASPSPSTPLLLISS